MTLSCSARQAGSEHVLFDIEKSISIFDLGSGQGQVNVRSGPTSQIVWHHMRVSPSCRDLLAKNGLWPHLTSFDLISPPRDPRTSVAPGSSQMG